MKWRVHENTPAEFSILLVTPAQFNSFPEGFEFISISGGKYIKGTDYIDDDVRFGHLAFGIKMPLEDHPEAELLSKLKLTGSL